jgi:glycosyltransferase involved in cell wall biosynthesis
LRAFEALEKIFAADSAFPDVLITGQLTHVLDLENKDDPLFQILYIKDLRTKIARSKMLRDRLIVGGNLPDDIYVDALRYAQLLFHPAIFDNGTYAVVEAAWYGVPSVSARYAAMEEIEKRFNLPLTYFNPRDVNDIAHVLYDAVNNRDVLKLKLPDRSLLGQKLRARQSVDFWQQIRSVVGCSG